MSFFCINCRSKTDPGFKACPYCGDPITDFLRRYTEEPIDGKYKILSRLGIGGMGEVYKVLHLHLNTPRVVKMMRPNLSGDEQAHERFIREAQLATRIQHPNVAALFDFSTLGDGSYYMVWEYIDGITVADLLRARGFLSPRYAATLSLQVLDGLQAIHRQGVVHRDISPENVMITFDDEDNERVKIIDLGIAKQWTNETDDQTKTGMFVGKWKYCSPEHLGMLKPDERIDGRADLYSYGIVLYELLTGQVPFVADSPHRFLLLHSTESPRPLEEVNPALGEIGELEAILFRALEKDREKRFRSARQFASALEAALPSLPDSPGLPTGAASPEITGVEDLGTLEAEQPGEDATVDVTTPSARLAPTVESSALGLSLDEAPFIAEPHATREGSMLVDRHGATVVQDAGDGSAHRWEGGSSLDHRTLRRSPVEEEESRASGRKGWVWVVAAVLLGLTVALAYWFSGAQDSPAGVGASSETSQAEQTAGAPVAPVMVGIQAWPWGQIEELRNMDSGERVELTDAVTPLTIDLQPGSYRLVVQNPAYDEPLSRVFEARPGLVVALQFEASPALPDLGGLE